MKDNKTLVREMLDNSNNDSAHKFAANASKAMGISEKEFFSSMNEGLKTINVGSDKITRTEVKDVGKGTTTTHDLSLIMHVAQKDFPEVFSKNSNSYRPDLYQSDKDSFGKSGAKSDGRWTYMAKSGAVTFAVAATAWDDQAAADKLFTEQLANAREAIEKYQTKPTPQAIAPRH